MYSADGCELTTARQYVTTPNCQSFLHFGADPAHITDQREADHFYTDGGARRIVHTPNETHPWGMISKVSVASQVAFFEAAFGAPHPIDANTQVWQIKTAFT